MTDERAVKRAKEVFGEDSFAESDDHPGGGKRYYVGALPQTPGKYHAFMGRSWEEAFDIATRR